MPLRVLPPVQVIGEDGRAHQLRRHPLRIDQPCQVDQVPDHPGAGKRLVDAVHRVHWFVGVQVMDVVADLAAAAHPTLDLRQGNLELGADVITRQVDMGHPAIEDQLGGQLVLCQVERWLVAQPYPRRVGRGPHHHDTRDDLWRHQNGRGHIGQAADCSHVQRFVLFRQGTLDDVPGCGAVDRFFQGRQEA